MPNSKINEQDSKQGSNHLIGMTVDPTLIPVEAPKGTVLIRLSFGSPGNPIGMYQKQDDGKTTNWEVINGGLNRKISINLDDGNPQGDAVREPKPSTGLAVVDTIKLPKAGGQSGVSFIFDLRGIDFPYVDNPQFGYGASICHFYYQDSAGNPGDEVSMSPGLYEHALGQNFAGSVLGGSALPTTIFADETPGEIRKVEYFYDNFLTLSSTPPKISFFRHEWNRDPSNSKDTFAGDIFWLYSVVSIEASAS
jgi:hypothetical protein